MSDETNKPESQLGEDAALRMIMEGTATETGECFFLSLVKYLAAALGTLGDRGGAPCCCVSYW